MADRLPVISNNLPTVHAKAGERERLQADLEAFLRKRGNKIQQLGAGDLGKPLHPNYRDQATAMAHGRIESRRRRRQGGAE